MIFGWEWKGGSQGRRGGLIKLGLETVAAAGMWMFLIDMKIWYGMMKEERLVDLI